MQCLTAKQYWAYTHTHMLTHREYWVSSLQGRMISPTHASPPFHTQLPTSKELSSPSLAPSLSAGMANTIITAITSTQAALLLTLRGRRFTARAGSHRLVEDRDRHDGWADAFQAAGHHHQLPPFPASRWPLSWTPSATGWVRAFGHMGREGGRVRSELTQQINVGKHSRNCHFSWGYLTAE